MTVIDALFREIAFGLCGVGGALQGLAAADHVREDMRLEPASDLSEDDYPWIIVRDVTTGEDNQVRYSRNRVEIEVIGRRTSATKGGALLDQIRTALLNHFEGKRRTWGKFTEDGTADPDGGLKFKCFYVSTASGFDEDLVEKAHIHIFLCSGLRS